ncbi:hypothetical protein VP01_329g3 [Puccinia sorghi]|uniref:phosphoserine transaminase n=1 Tax=Puccinia sorghi TaxID=27349 RepID=A0A0L6UXJ2_9BASI|nr:hypothetical protein VP01_329g3 [Puccinia sorghi]
MTTSERERTINLGAGPCTLPTSVLETAARGLLDYEGTGMGVVELSHRSKEFQELNEMAQTDIRRLLRVPEGFEILFMQGGGLTQFSCVVMNLVNQFRLANQTNKEDQVVVDYLVTGSWSLKASKEAARLGCRVNVVADGRSCCPDNSNSFRGIPRPSEWRLSSCDAKEIPAFLYYCDNETVDGVEFGSPGIPVENLPAHYLERVPLVVDMSSNILTRQIPEGLWKYIGIVFAGAQKNLGPAGLTLVLVRKNLIPHNLDLAVPLGGLRVPDLLCYKHSADHRSLYNTPPIFSIYVASLVLRHLIQQGGIQTIQEINLQKSLAVYHAIDSSQGFYFNSILPDARSRINIVFNCRAGPSTDDLFIQEADKFYGIKQIKGHRSVGGIRVSLYNAVTLDQVNTLCTFMLEFAARNR